MDQDFAQRRRIAVAVAITVVLVPAALLLNRGGDDSAEPGSTLVGEVRLPGDTTVPGTRSNGSATDVMGSTPTGFLDGTVPNNTDDLPTIAIPRPTESLTGSASFSRSISNATTCLVRDLTVVPFDANVTITNLDNSRSVRCVAAAGPQSDADVVLNTDAFLQIGDLTDAPLSVEITW